MTTIALTFVESAQEITSGIPKYLSITANVPATIYFTLDGSTPTTDSVMYVGTIEMPYATTSITVSAFGIDADGYESAILTQVFAADITAIDRERLVDYEGVRVDDYSDPLNIEVGWDADGDTVAYTDMEDLNRRTLYSATGRLGVAEGNIIEIGTPDPEDTPYPFDDDFNMYSSVSDGMFDPYALTITNDFREEGPIQIINRPFGSMRVLTNERWGQDELRTTDSTYISGGFVRRFYSKENNLMASYYFDHNSTRWVLGYQDLPTSVTVPGFSVSNQPLVFQWIDRGRHSSIPI